MRFEFDLNNFSGVLRRGDNTKLVHELKEHLKYLGYLDPNNMDSKNDFDHHLEHDIKKYQEFYSINIKEVVDINTIESIRTPRCGAPDFVSPQVHPKSLYTFLPENPKWKKKRLKYHLTKSVTEAYRSPIEQALQEWQSLTPFTFTRVSTCLFSRDDIKVSFKSGDHGDGFPFTPNRPRILAHSFPSPDGRVHFNAAIRWASNGEQSAFDVKTIALHEFGHVLGLGHSAIREAIMFPQFCPGQRKILNQDDIDGIKALCGFQELADVNKFLT